MFILGCLLIAVPFAAVIAFLIFAIGPLMTLLVVLLATAAGLIVELGLKLVSL